jgi:hypothetical protein
MELIVTVFLTENLGNIFEMYGIAPKADRSSYELELQITQLARNAYP